MERKGLFGMGGFSVFRPEPNPFALPKGSKDVKAVASVTVSTSGEEQFAWKNSNKLTGHPSQPSNPSLCLEIGERRLCLNTFPFFFFFFFFLRYTIGNPHQFAFVRTRFSLITPDNHFSLSI